MPWEHPQERTRLTLLEPDVSRCFVCGCGRPISPAFAPSEISILVAFATKIVNNIREVQSGGFNSLSGT